MQKGRPRADKNKQLNNLKRMFIKERIKINKLITKWTKDWNKYFFKDVWIANTHMKRFQ